MTRKIKKSEWPTSGPAATDADSPWYVTLISVMIFLLMIAGTVIVVALALNALFLQLARL